MDKQSYRPLLSAPARDLDAARGRGAVQLSPDEGSRRQENKARVACNPCRRRKTKCDGAEPACSACSLQPNDCVYENLTKKRHEDGNTDNLLGLLRRAPGPEAIQLLDLWRTYGELWHMCYPVNVHGEQPAKFHVLDLQAELAVKNPASYPLESQFPSLAAMADHLAQPPPQEGVPALLHVPRTAFPPSSFVGLDITYWTSVPIPNDLAVHLISLYLETDHPLLGTFDPHLFVADLISNNEKYCSCLMVTAILYLSCQSSMSDEERPGHLLSELARESRDNWLRERDTDSWTVLGATFVLCMADIANGKNGIVLEYFNNAMHMGQRLGLFGIEIRVRQGDIADPEALRVASCCAWGTFTWIVLASFLYQQPRLECPRLPPALPIPGEKSSSQHKPSGRSHYMAIFPILCQFASIILDLSLRYHQAGRVVDQVQPCQQFAEFKYRELLAWAETLPPWMTNGQANASPHTIIFHIWYHSIILDIFRPFIQNPTAITSSSNPPPPSFHPPNNHLLRTFSAPDSTPSAVFSASVDQLKYLIVTYRSHYAPSSHSILWHTGLLYLANAMLSGPKSPSESATLTTQQQQDHGSDHTPGGHTQNQNQNERHTYFLICIYGYATLRRRFLLANIMVRALLSMALRRGRMPSAEARRILAMLGGDGGGGADDDDTPTSTLHAAFVGDSALAMRDLDAASVENMASQFSDAAILQEFTHAEMEW